ncbi:hypothetical protein AJ80_07605 [Polytolypa hystricis UAMH7299]|uniref:GGDEF domain-containing protein n=1 Tax=Polytolypa hystricis (strain UAMH7299) TaxID=1447883 RepID=A0A2B7XLS0_POLH7|nr:hypothetical protein AJ80_07605 [Polytolypa hystricis UAMH7299]
MVARGRKRDTYKAAIDAAAIFIELEADGATVIRVNDLFCTISGYSAKDVVGSECPVFSLKNRHAEQQEPPPPYERIWAIVSQGITWKGVLAGVRKGCGSIYWIDATILPIFCARQNDRIVKYSMVCFDVTEYQTQLHALQWQASHDFLTGLPNRSWLQEHLKQSALALPAARRQQQQQQQPVFALGVLDLDGFKPINDTYGHEMGDRLLVEVATRLRAHLRQDDMLARVGGDEFVLILSNGGGIQTTTLPSILRRFLHVLSQPYTIDGASLKIAGSLGLTIWTADVDPAALLHRADQAMYDAKKAGGDCFRIFEAATGHQVDST